MMNEADMKRQGFVKHEPVDLKSIYNGEERVAKKFIVVPMPIASGCIATYFPEANCLVSIDAVARGSNTPVSKSVVVTLEKSAEAIN
jgi:hypothetical protein